MTRRAEQAAEIGNLQSSQKMQGRISRAREVCSPIVTHLAQSKRMAEQGRRASGWQSKVAEQGGRRFARKFGCLGRCAPLGRSIWLALRTFGALLVGAALRSAPRLALSGLRPAVLSGWCLLSSTSSRRSALACPHWVCNWARVGKAELLPKTDQNPARSQKSLFGPDSYIKCLFSIGIRSCFGEAILEKWPANRSREKSSKNSKITKILEKTEKTLRTWVKSDCNLRFWSEHV